MRGQSVLMVLFALPASAQVYPQPGEGDPRIQTVQYDPLQIISLSVAPGFQTIVELVRGERVETIAVGDSISWQVSAGKRGDFFFVKNVGAIAKTNMSVVTSSRVYNFELSPGINYGDVSPYHVRIEFPVSETQSEQTDIKPVFDYLISGSKAIRPSKVYQEGDRTIVEWPDDSPLPAVFTLENGSEAIVNGQMQDDRFVIAGTPERLIFRIDRNTAYATRKARKITPDD